MAWVRISPRILTNLLNKVPNWQHTTYNSQIRPGESRHFLTSSKFSQEVKDDANLVSSIQKTVKQYGYLELRNLDLDILIKPSCPSKYPDQTTAIFSFYSKTGTTSPEFLVGEEKLSLVPTTAYVPKENHGTFEVPIKYGNINNCVI